MHVKRLLSLLVCGLLGWNLAAQDIHFTQYYMSPMTLNPAQAGNFEGTVRIGGIFRDQWASVINKQFQTPSAFVDAPIIQGFRKRDWVGAAFHLFNDKAGVGGLSHLGAKIGASYHLALNKNATTYVSVGFQFGQEQRKVDGSKFQFEDGIQGTPAGQAYDPGKSIDNGRILGNAKYTDYDAGIMLTSRLNKRMDFNLGFSMFYLTEPNYSLLGGAVSPGPGPNPPPSGGGNAKLPRRTQLHGRFNAALTDEWSISPSFLFQTMAGSDEIALQGLAGYLLNPEKDITLQFGAGYRLRDALQALVGMKYKDLRVGLAYDINTSDLNTVSNYRGGFEIAANYIIKIYKPAVIKPKVLCPRF